VPGEVKDEPWDRSTNGDGQREAARISVRPREGGPGVPTPAITSRHADRAVFPGGSTQEREAGAPWVCVVSLP